MKNLKNLGELIEDIHERLGIPREKLKKKIDYPKTQDGSEILNAISENCSYKQCNGDGWLFLRLTSGEEVMKPCACSHQIKINRKIKSAKVPLDFQHVMINSFEIDIYSTKENMHLASVAKKIVVNYVNKFDDMCKLGKGLYFYSESMGSGKSRLAISVLNALIKKKGVNGLYITTKNLFEELKASFDKGTTDDVLNSFLSVPILVLDDLGVEKVTEWVESTFTQILDTRMTQKLPTIITSNLSQDELIHVYQNGRVVSRIKKMTLPIIMPEEDIREKLAKMEQEQIVKELLESYY